MLVVGSKQILSQHLPHENFLLINDGDFTVPRAKVFDVAQDRFNPLKDIDYRRAREIADVLYAAFPQGQNTLTVRNGKRALAKALLRGQRLNKLSFSKDPSDLEAKGLIEDVLFSPVLKRVLCSDDSPAMTGTIHMVLDRSVLGDLDCYILGNLFIAQFEGTVVLPDFGFYQAPFHTALMRQGRLIAQIRSFDEVEKIRSHAILMEPKIASHCTPDDAKILAVYEGLMPSTNEYNDFIANCIGG